MINVEGFYRIKWFVGDATPQSIDVVIDDVNEEDYKDSDAGYYTNVVTVLTTLRGHSKST